MNLRGVSPAHSARFSSPFKGEAGRGMVFFASPDLLKPIPTLTLPLKGREITPGQRR
jgi:hypothetical protein